MILNIIIAVLCLYLGAVLCTKFSPLGKKMNWTYACFRIFFWFICLFLYRRKVQGLKNIPTTGGVMLIANHTAYVDVILLGLICPRPIRFVSWDKFEENGILHWFMRRMQTIPISPTHAKSGLRAATEALKNGEVVCVFPEGVITRNSNIQPFQGGFQIIAKASGAPIIPIYIDGLWGSIFSYRSGKFFFKRPRFRLTSVIFNIGTPFKIGNGEGEQSITQARQILLELGYEAYSLRKDFKKKHLAEMLFNAASAHPFQISVIDYTREKKSLSRGMLVSVAYQLSKKIRREVKEHRVGIILPPGIAGMIANYAVSLAGKIPVNINFTLGKLQLEACFKKANIETMITVGAMKKQLNERFSDFPWPEKEIDILDALKGISKKSIVGGFLAIWLMPREVLKKIWRIPTNGGGKEAALLFTSGSSGMPKAAVLTHRNIIANCMQIDDYDILPPKTRLLCNLPIFHSFGFTTLLWFAVSRDIVAVAVPSPLDFQKNITAIQDAKVTVMLSTPTFLRTYLKKATPEQMESLLFTVAGAEKTPEGFADAWEEKFPNCFFLEGYGMTEASPVVSVNKPNVVVEDARGDKQVFLGNQPKSVGILFPGMSAKVCDLENDQLLPFNTQGMLYLKGPNIFPGYLNDEGVPVCVLDKDQWYKTGDLVSMDENGFIYIKGRLSRFSKIGGEMVPHGTIEEEIVKILDVNSETIEIAITGRPDVAKGEVLVLVTTIKDINLQDLGKKLSEAGLANLWIPKEMKVVETIPVLGTGKLDIKGLAELAKAA